LLKGQSFDIAKYIINISLIKMVYESREWETAIKRNNRYLNNKLLLDNIDEVDGLSDRLQIKLSTNALLCRRIFESQKVVSQIKDKKNTCGILPLEWQNHPQKQLAFSLNAIISLITQ
jgi:hypothetical protein